MRLYKSILIGLASLVSVAAFGQAENDDMYFTRADRAKMKSAPVTVARPTALPTYEYDRAAAISAAAPQSTAAAGGRYANPDFRGNANVQGGEENYRYFDEGMGTAAIFDDSYRPRYNNFNSRAAQALSDRPVININNRFVGGSPFWGPAAMGWGAGWGMNSWGMNSWAMNSWGWNDPWMMNSFGWGNPGFGWGNPGFGWGMSSFGWGNPGFGWGMSSWGWNAGFGVGWNSFGWNRWNNCPPGMWGGGWYRPAATRVVVVNRPNPYEGRANRAGVINNRPMSNSEQAYDANRRYPSRMRSYDTNVRNNSFNNNQGGRTGSGNYNYYSPSNDTRRDSFRSNSGSSGSNNSSRDTFRSNTSSGSNNSSFGGRSVGGGSTGGGGGSRPAGRIR